MNTRIISRRYSGVSAEVVNGFAIFAAKSPTASAKASSTALPAKQLAGALHQKWRRIHRGDADPCIGDVSVRPLHHNGDTGQRIVNRSTNPQFSVDTAVVCR